MTLWPYFVAVGMPITLPQQTLGPPKLLGVVQVLNKVPYFPSEGQKEELLFFTEADEQLLAACCTSISSAVQSWKTSYVPLVRA